MLSVLATGALTMSESTLPPGVGSVSPEDQAAAYEGPAFASNHFIVQQFGNSLRIAFLERFDMQKTSRFRTAVSIQLRDLQVLADLITVYADAMAQAAKSTGNV